MYSIYYRNVLQEISGDLRGEEKGTFLPESESERRRCQNGRSPQPWKYFTYSIVIHLYMQDILELAVIGNFLSSLYT